MPVPNGIRHSPNTPLEYSRSGREGGTQPATDTNRVLVSAQLCCTSNLFCCPLDRFASPTHHPLKVPHPELVSHLKSFKNYRSSYDLTLGFGNLQSPSSTRLEGLLGLISNFPLSGLLSPSSLGCPGIRFQVHCFSSTLPAYPQIRQIIIVETTETFSSNTLSVENGSLHHCQQANKTGPAQTRVLDWLFRFLRNQQESTSQAAQIRYSSMSYVSTLQGQGNSTS